MGLLSIKNVCTYFIFELNPYADNSLILDICSRLICIELKEVYTNSCNEALRMLWWEIINLFIHFQVLHFVQYIVNGVYELIKYCKLLYCIVSFIPNRITAYYINKNRNKYVFSNISEYLFKLGNKK